ncbi:MAG TPA: aminotransferase class V-fold PLP-dependent enzyme [Anaerolineae bacterium]|nr:aminotransferase class V-fold PLP-dependent enzyme [Anaerolineae bacterium]
MTAFKSLFMLDDDIVFLNHGSFGACPRPVFEQYQVWQRRLERQPVLFLGREINDLLGEMRARLAAFVGAEADEVVGVANATTAVNIVARSLALGVGDEVLTTDHEYGACHYTWEMLAAERGFTYKRQAIALPVATAAEMVEQFWAGVTAATKVIFISHISSATALRMPIEAICARAREAGIITVVDGAHSVGQLPLVLAEIGADFYTSNAHKWLCAPKGSAFLYARRERQDLIKPLVVSWGYQADDSFTVGSQFLDYLSWGGTTDPAALLTIPAAIDFQMAHQWEKVQVDCQALVASWLDEMVSITGERRLYPADDEWFRLQLGAALLPVGVDGVWLKEQLYGRYRIEMPMTTWNGRWLARISVQAYNDEAEVRTAAAALGALLAEGGWL